MTLKQLVKLSHKCAVEKGFWEHCYHCDGKGKNTYIASMMKPMIKRGSVIENSYTSRDKKITETCNVCEGRGYSTVRNDGELLMLIVSELGEALEGLRKGDRKNFEEEIADTFIRLGDLCGGRDIDIEKIILKKMAKNKKRPYKHNKRF